MNRPLPSWYLQSALDVLVGRVGERHVASALQIRRDEVTR